METRKKGEEEMSILIKGMMMPVNCQTCPFVQRELDEETPIEINLRCGFTQKVADNPAFERNKDCPLVEIPPHGQLIDADKFQNVAFEKFLEAWGENDNAFWQAWDQVLHWLNIAPTIIEAEEEKK